MNVLWEEKNSIEALKKIEKCIENTNEISIIEIKNVSEKNVCNDIMN